jgi:hypothetical protein
MIYRRLPKNPPRLLLRIVAPASALVSLLACSSSSTPTPPAAAGSVAMPEDGGDAAFEVTGVAASSSGGTADASIPFMGVVLYPDANYGSSSGGSVAFPTDAPEEIYGSAESGSPDAGDEAGPCGGGVCGVIVHPDSG